MVLSYPFWFLKGIFFITNCASLKEIMTVPPDVYPNFFCEYDPFPPTAPVYGIVNPNFANVRFPIQEAHVRQHFQNQNEGSARTTTRNKIDENTSWSWVPFTLGFFDFVSII